MKRTSQRPRELSAARTQWLAACLMRGIPQDVLVQELAQAGVAPDVARRAAVTLQQDPVFLAGMEQVEYARKLEWRMDVRRRLDALAAKPTHVPRRRMPSAATLVNDFVSRNRPVVITGWVNRWPGFKRWSPEYLRSRFGHVPVEVADRRSSTRFYDLDVRRLSRTMPMAEFVDWAVAVGRSNERYMVANNDNLGGRLRPLLRDIHMPPGVFQPRRVKGCVYFWFGPAGTLTDWHHDTTNIMFCQVVGRKRIQLLSPMHHALLRQTEAYYAAVDPRQAFPDLPVMELTLQPGEALLIPVAWWHRVEALDLSMSVSMTHFRFSNDHEAGNPYAR